MVASGPELWFNTGMQKSRALELLGGTTTSAAKAIGISYQAVEKWPDVLPGRIADRVVAAVARQHLPPELLGADVVTREAKATA
jgi:hypothetical protein